MLVSDMFAVLHLQYNTPYPLVINVTVTDVLKQSGHPQNTPSTLLSWGVRGTSVFNHGAWYLRKRQLQNL